MITASVSAEPRLQSSGVPWEAYLFWCDQFWERPIRVTYDRGEMEIMSLPNRHEKRKSILARLVETLTIDMEIDIASGGMMTLRREDLRRALEADESYWIANEPEVRGREDIDLEVDPPPDLALEIEVSRSAMNRMAIYAALRVPEVWRWDGVVLLVFLLSTRGTYRQSDRSKAFPFLPLTEFAEFLTRTGLSETQLLLAFRAWVRKHKKQGWKATK
jgi:Uma2 family endonuclease